MANTTKLFEKKLNLLKQPNDKEEFERIFYYEVLIKDFQFSLPLHKTIYVIDLPELIRRCNEWDIVIIGVETHMDSQQPLFVTCIEEIKTSGTSNEWLTESLTFLKQMGVTKDLVVYIDIPNEKIQLLKNIYGLK